MITVTWVWELALNTSTSEFLSGLFKIPHWAKPCELPFMFSLVLWFQPSLYKQDVWDVPDKDFFLTLVIRTPAGQHWELQRACTLYRQGNWGTQTPIPEPGTGVSDSTARSLVAPPHSDGICCASLWLSWLQKKKVFLKSLSLLHQMICL